MDGIDNATLTSLRVALLAILALGLLGTGAELLLLGHYEEWQRIPLVLITIGVIVVGWHAAAASAASVRTLQIVTLLFVLSGAVGVGLHFRGNAAFELEMYPSLSGFEFVRRTLTGATPTLAPGTMVMLGLIGLAHTYRHPRLRSSADSHEEGET